MSKLKHIRHGVGSVRPYLYGHLDLIDFVKHAFDAEELEHIAMGEKSAHSELKIGCSVVVIEAGELPPAVVPTRSSIYVFVEDVDAACKRALEAGATSITAPEDKPYQERGAGVKDTFGNTWWIATYTG
ncbi:MAG TPA: VOC family protein [Candidatus Binataceae bacterium]|nr:VOC family protein [Candidatus Binataceae bacterium]